MLLHLEGAIAPVGTDAVPQSTENFDGFAVSLADAVAALRSRVADAETSLALAMATARINGAEVARLARIVRLREELAEERAALAVNGGVEEALAVESTNRFVNAGQVAIGVTAASIVFGTNGGANRAA